MKRLKEKYQAFKKWQQQPHQVAPMSEEQHDCPTCGTHYQGNYCPRCGQSARIGRYSFKKAFLLFLDVWGLGNRGMFRTLRDLVLRPGYMIRDYLQGMQMAYFPPFKMFFLLVALSLLIESGFNILGKNYIAKAREDLERGLKEAELSTNKKNTNETATIKLDENTPSEATVVQNDSTVTEATTSQDKDNVAKNHTEEYEEYPNELSVRAWAYTMKIIKEAFDWYNKNQTIIMLIILLIISVPLYSMFRHSPNIPDMKFSEFFVAIVYITNMITIYSAAISFLCLSEIFSLLATLLAVPALKQLSGYSYLSTSLRAISVFTIMILAIVAIIMVTAAVMGFFYAFRNQ